MSKGYRVTIQLASIDAKEGCGVIVTAADGTSTTIADGLWLAAAVKVAYRVRNHLVEGKDLSGIHLVLRHGEVTA